MDYKIESLDTNLLVYLVTGYNPKLHDKIVEFIKQGTRRFYIDDQAITEMVYVLNREMHISRYQTSELVEAVIYEPYFITNRDLFNAILPVYLSHPKLSFNDCYIAEKAKQKKALPLWTTDHKLALQSDLAKEFK